MILIILDIKGKKRQVGIKMIIGYRHCTVHKIITAKDIYLVFL